MSQERDFRFPLKFFSGDGIETINPTPLGGVWILRFPSTPGKINMEPEPLEKEKHLPNHRSCRTHRVGAVTHRQSIVSLVLNALLFQTIIFRFYVHLRGFVYLWMEADLN